MSPRYEQPSGLAPSLAAWQPAAGGFDAEILGMPGLISWWDFDPDRVTPGTNISLANRVSGGAATVERTTLSNLVLSTANLPEGGQMRQSGSFAGTTALDMGGSFPSAANSSFTEVLMWRQATNGNKNATSMTLWRGPNANNNTHRLQVQYKTLTFSVYDATTALSLTDTNVAVGAWNWAICGFDNSSKAMNLQVNGATPQTVTGTGQAVLQSLAYFGALASGGGGLTGNMGPMLLFGAAGSVATGSLFHSSRAADLARMNDFCAATLGRLDLI